MNLAPLRWSRLAKLDVLLATTLVLLAIGMASPYFLGRLRHESAKDKRPYTVEEVGALHLRLQAADNCEKGLWSACLSKLDDAKTLDPAGDSAEYVQNARRVAGRMLESASTTDASRH